MVSGFREITQTKKVIGRKENNKKWSILIQKQKIWEWSTYLAVSKIYSVVIGSVCRHNKSREVILGHTILQYLGNMGCENGRSLSTVQWWTATFVVLVRDTFVTSHCENSVLLGCYAARSVNSWPKFRDNLSVPSLRIPLRWDWPLKMGPTGCPETSVRN